MKAAAPPPPPTPRLHTVALVILLSTVVGRAVMMQNLRDPFNVAPGSQPYPTSSAGPAAAIVLDLLCCVPGLLILLSRTLDRKSLTAPSWAARLFGALAALALASGFWAADKFAAVIGAADLVAAFAVLWAAAQLVRGWGPFRLVTAFMFGLLLVYLTQCIIYKYLELPDTIRSFEENRLQFFAERGWKPNDWMARQFELKLVHGEMLGFNSSSNSLAAMLVLFMGISAGLVIQRFVNRAPVSALPVALAIPIGIWILCYTECKAAVVTSLLVAVFLLIRWKAPR